MTAADRAVLAGAVIEMAERLADSCTNRVWLVSAFPGPDFHSDPEYLRLVRQRYRRQAALERLVNALAN